MNQIKTFLDRMRADNKLDKLKDSFMKFNTDQERVIFTLDYLSQYNDIIPSTTGMPKNAELSEELRQRGTELLITGDLDNNTIDTWIEGLKLYTQSIAFAPYPSEKLALAYDKRSQVLFRLGLYSECIKDIDRALELKYLHDDEIARLYLRKTECLIILGKCSCVENALKEAQHWLNKMSSNDPDKKELLSELNTLRCKAVQTEQSVTDNNSTRTKVKESENKSKISSQNAEAPCASDAVAIKYNDHYGRHLIATRDIEPGEIIAVEEPYTLLLLRQNKETHCSNCLEVCLANIPCNYCTYAMYCSMKCKNDEWEKCHHVECNVFPALIDCGGNDLDLLSLKVAVLALKEAGNNIEKLKTMIEEFDQNNDPRVKNYFYDGKLQSDKYVCVYNLSTYIENREFEDLFMMSWNTCIILYHLATHTELFDVELPTDFNSLAGINGVTFFGGLILRHLQIISINAHAFCEGRGLQHLQRGVALMPFCSLINHSCDPNILRQSRSKHIVLHAIYPIQKGQQLFDNYGPYYACVERDIRKQELKKQYLFDCNCVACQKNWHLYPQLSSYITLVEKAEDKAEIEEALQNLDTYYDLAKEYNVDDKPYIKQELLKMIQILHNYTSIPCSETVKVFITLKRIYAFEGNRFKLPQISTCQM